MDNKKRFVDLYNKSFKQNTFEFTDFLSVSEQSEIYEIKEISPDAFTVSGGFCDAERCMVRFGNVSELGYEEPFPISILKIEPLSVKFSDELSHRDFLGALMNLGIKRETLGDIIVAGEKTGGKIINCTAFLFCMDNMAEYIIASLDKVKHTTVRVSKVEELPALAIPEPEEYEFQSASERLDGIIAGLYNKSRSEVKNYFTGKLVFLNGRLIENPGHTLKEGDRVTVRGFGRLTYIGVNGVSKKGRLYIKVLK